MEIPAANVIWSRRVLGYPQPGRERMSFVKRVTVTVATITLWVGSRREASPSAKGACSTAIVADTMVEEQRQGEVRAQVVLERVGELVDYRAPWHRRLWSAGTILELREILEYSAPTQTRSSSTIGDKAFKQLQEDTLKRATKDIGIGDRNFRKRLCGLLSDMKTSDEYHYHSLRYLVDSAENGYLDRWSIAVSDGYGSEERIARHLVESLLDRGLAPTRFTIGLHTRGSAFRIAGKATLAMMKLLN
jgi:hypothetical protein